MPRERMKCLQCPGSRYVLPVIARIREGLGRLPCLGGTQHRVSPLVTTLDAPGCQYLNLGPGRTVRVLYREGNPDPAQPNPDDVSLLEGEEPRCPSGFGLESPSFPRPCSPTLSRESGGSRTLYEAQDPEEDLVVVLHPQGIMDRGDDPLRVDDLHPVKYEELGVLNPAFDESDMVAAVNSVLVDGGIGSSGCAKLFGDQSDSICETVKTVATDSTKKIFPDDTSVASPSCDSTKSSERPILMFIHGVGGSAETWNSQIKYFTDLGYSVVAPDLLGHGFSSAPDKIAMYKFKHLLEDMVAVFQHFFQNTKHRVVLVGHSYGALFATCLALQFPSRVSVLCLISSGGPYPPPRSSKTGLLSLPSWALDLLKPCLLAKARRSLLYASHTKRVSLSQAFDIPSHVLHHVVHGQELPENSGDALLFRRLSLPTLLVHGMRDPLVSLVEACEMERVIPRAHLEVIPEAGHMCMLDTPSELNRLLLKFLIKWRRLMTPLPSAHHIHSSAVMPT